MHSKSKPRKLIFSLSSLKIILTLSIFYSILFVIYPRAYKYFYYDKQYIKKLQFWRLLSAIFILPPEINSLFIIMTRYGFLHIIEQNHICVNGDFQVEMLFFTISCAISLFFANFNGLTDFGNSFNMALCWFVCKFVREINLYGFQVPSMYAPYLFLVLEIVFSKNHNAIYGLVHSIFYFEFRKRHKIPRIFEVLVLRILYPHPNKKIIRKVRLR